MPAQTPFEVQGHRGARGLAPENTLVSFEIALDLGVTSIETDVHLSKDGVAVLFHDAHLSEPLCTARPGAAAPSLGMEPLVRSLSLDELRRVRIGPPHSPATPLAERFAHQCGMDPFGIPTLDEFFEFVLAYAGPEGEAVGKTAVQRDRAARVCLDIELKRVPARPEMIGDGFTGTAPALLEQLVVEAIRRANLAARARVRSFDHRAMHAIAQLEPGLSRGLLIHHTAPIHPERLLREAGAEFYCPDHSFVDADLVRRVHESGGRVLPYTANDPDDWARLLPCGVDGITTDYPDRLITWLTARGVAFQ